MYAKLVNNLDALGFTVITTYLPEYLNKTVKAESIIERLIENKEEKNRVFVSNGKVNFLGEEPKYAFIEYMSYSLKKYGKKAYKVLDCRCLSRIDFIVDKKDGPMIIEVNTLPGMTDMSLFPDAARYIGVSYDNLVEKILELGLNAHREYLE